jgi:hypothetical protein
MDVSGTFQNVLSKNAPLSREMYRRVSITPRAEVLNTGEEAYRLRKANRGMEGGETFSH